MTRVAFLLRQSAERWHGGVNYLRGLLRALAATPEVGLEPVLFASRQVPPSTLAVFAGLESHRTGLLTPWDPRWIAARALARGIGADVLLERRLRSSGIAVLSHAHPLGPRAQLPTIAWIPDFQHRYHPRFFRPQELAALDAQFEAWGRHAAVVVVSSEAARRDLATFHPAHAAKARVLRFVGGAAAPEAPAPRADLEARYGFQGPYLLVPNQFWAHKNHGLILEALAILRRRGQDVLVLATGSREDYRSPGHFDALLRQRDRLGVQDRFLVLGMLPYVDLASLMRGAVALMNPSLFEGWSTVVEEAKTLGKRILLSDIPVHREQDPERGVYFATGDAEGLATAMWDAWTSWDPAEDERARLRARAALPARQADFARCYAAIVREAAAAARRSWR